MAYGEKYYHIYCDRYNNTFRISLRELDYSGPSRLVEGGNPPWTRDRENASGLKMGGVYPSRATATFVSEDGFDLEELYTGEENTYQLVRLKNGDIDWIGYVIPDGFREGNYDEAHPYLEVSASDNLPTLKGVPFTDEYGDNYGDEDGEHIQSFLWVIKEALKKTGSLLPIRTMVDIKPLVESSSGVVLSRLGAFNEYAPSEVGIFKEGVDFGFIKVGDTVNVSGSASGNNGTYTVTGFVNSVPPDAPYIRIQLSPQVPVTVKENVILEIISVQPQLDMPDPLQTQHDVRVWIRDSNIEGKTYYEARGGAMMTWDVLDAIARQFNVIIQQNLGRWEVKRWNADKVEPETYSWFIYDSEGVLTGRQPFGEDLLIPCNATEQRYRLFGTSRKMDRVLKNVVVNYRYKYKQEGDSLNNLVVNGNFEGDFNPYPRGWTRIDMVPPNVNLQQMIITRVTTGLPAGIPSAMRIRNFSDHRTMSNLTAISNTQVNRGDRLQIEWYERIEGATVEGAHGTYALSIFRDLDHALGNSRPPSRAWTTGIAFDMVNSGGITPRPPRPGGIPVIELVGRWRDQMEGGDSPTHYRFITSLDRTGQWRKIQVTVDSVPIDGYVKLEVLGTVWGTLNMNIVDERLRSRVYAPSATTPARNEAYQPTYRPFFSPASGTAMTVTGFVVGRIVDPDNEAVPQIDPFMYPDFQAQLSRNFTDTIPDIEVLTGDDYGDYAEDRISGMMWGGQRTSMWDTWDNRYGWSRQGLVTAKSVIEMYWKPTRLLEVELHAPNIHWSTRFQFEEMPGLRFAILRGNIGGYHDSFRGTLTEVHNEATPPLPPGGNDGGNTVEPNWQPTGVRRCIRDESGLNTGEVEEVERDINPASPTYGQERWVLAGTDTAACPVGNPIDLYWGASTLPIDHTTLEYFPYAKDGDDYTMQFDNDGSGKYLVFLWRRSLGAVQSILDVEMEETLSSWVVEPDITINGYTYGVMRMQYMTGVFTGLDKTFKIN